MYAVIELGSRQFRVSQGDTILLDQPEDAPIRPRVLLAVDGSNVITDRAKLDKVTVNTTVLGMAPGKKTRVMKFRPKTGGTTKRTIGHRSRRLKVRVEKLAL